MTNQETENHGIKTILITPDGTYINNIVHYPSSITIVMDDGLAFNIDEAISILEKNKPKVKRPSFISKMKRGVTAFKLAYRDTANSSSIGPV